MRASKHLTSFGSPLLSSSFFFFLLAGLKSPSSSVDDSPLALRRSNASCAKLGRGAGGAGGGWGRESTAATLSEENGPCSSKTDRGVGGGDSPCPVEVSRSGGDEVEGTDVCGEKGW